MRYPFPHTALFCILKKTSWSCELCHPEPYEWSPPEYSEDTVCTCTDIRFSFVPAWTEFFLDKQPNSPPLETVYNIHIEKNMLYSDRTEELTTEKLFGFDVASSDPAGVEPLLEFMKTPGSYTIIQNPVVKNSGIYMKVAERRLLDFYKPNVVEKKENPHISRKKKAK
jgi:hypothetical protein